MNSGEISEISSTGTFDFCKFYIFDICEIFKNVKSPHQPTLFISDNKCHKLVSNYFHKNATRNIFCAYQLNKYTKNDSLSQFFYLYETLGRKRYARPRDSPQNWTHEKIHDRPSLWPTPWPTSCPTPWPTPWKNPEFKHLLQLKKSIALTLVDGLLWSLVE